MIVLRNKQTGKETIYNSAVFFKHNIDLSLFDIVSWEDVVELFRGKKERISEGKMEKAKAIEKINNSPLFMGYWFEPVENPEEKHQSAPLALNMAGTQRPNFNEKVVKTLTFDQLVEQHPNADPDYLRSEYNRITGAHPPKAAKGYPKAEQKTPYRMANLIRAWFMKILHKISGSVVLTVITTIATVVGTLLAIAIVNYWHGKGFTL